MSGNSSAYPWAVDGQDLCPVLSDSELLGAVFESADSEFLCNAIEIAGYRPNPLIPTSLQRTMRPAATGRNLGKHFVRVLADPAKRKQLFGRMSKALHSSRAANSYLAQQLFAFVSDRYNSILPDMDLVCYHRDKKYYLDAEKFASWLSTCAFDDANRRPIALFACAFAMLQSKDAPQFRQALLDADAGFHLLLLDEGEESKEPEPARVLLATPAEMPQPDSPPASEVAPTQVEPSLPACLDIDVSNDDAVGERDAASHLAENEVNNPVSPPVRVGPEPSSSGPAKSWDELAPDGSDVLADLVLRANERGPSAVRVLSAQLEKAIAGLNQRVGAFDRLQTQIADQLQQLRIHPLLEQCMTAVVPKLDNRNLSLDQEITLLENLELQTTGLLSACEQVQVLTQRLGRVDNWRAPENCGSPEEVRSALELRAETITTELKRIAKVEAEVVAFVERLSALSDDERLPFVESMLPEFWSDVLEFASKAQGLTADDRERLGVAAEIVGRVDIAAIIGAHLWTLSAEDAKSLLCGHTRKLAIQDHTQAYELLGFLSFGQIQQIAVFDPTLASLAAELILIGATTGHCLGELETLRPLLRQSVLHPVIANFYSVCIEMFERGSLSEPARQFQANTQPALAHPTKNEFREQQENLRKYLNALPRPPGDYYSQLRANAQIQFLLPLKEAIDSSDPVRTSHQWKSYGTIDEMVDGCIRSQGLTKSIAKHPKIIKHFRRDLEDISAEIDKWHRLTEPQVASSEASELTHSLKTLRKETSRNVDCSRLCAILNQLTNGESHPTHFPLFIGRRCNEDGSLDDPVGRGFVVPTMIHSWPSASESQSVSLSSVLLDNLLALTRSQPVSDREAISSFINRREFEAAREALRFRNDDALTRDIEEQFQRIRDSYRHQHSEILDEGHGIGLQDVDIATCIDIIEKEVESLDFPDADRWVGELQGYLERFRQQRDPERVSLLELLREAGCDPREEQSTTALRQQFESVKAEQELQRFHVLKLAELSHSDQLPNGFRNDLQLLAQKLDRPRLWIPSDYGAMELAESLDTCAKRMVKRLQDREFDPIGTDTLVDSLSRGLTERLQASTATTASDDLRQQVYVQINTLAKEIREGCSDQKVLHLLGRPGQIRQEENTAPSGAAPPQMTESSAKPIEKPQPFAKQVLEDVRGFLRARMQREMPLEVDGHDQLIEAVKGRHWPEVRRLAANPWFGNQDLPSQLSDVESLYAVALAQTLEADGECEPKTVLEACQIACLGLACDGQRKYYGLSREAEEQLLLHFVAKAAQRCGVPLESTKPLDQFLELLRQWDAPLSQASIAQWLSRLFSMASRLHDHLGRPSSAQLGQRIWDALTGVKGVGALRGQFLCLLFRWKRIEVLEVLCNSTTGRHAPLVWGCISSFERAEANPQVHARAMQLSSAVNEQLRREGQPWRLLFGRLQSEMLHTGGIVDPVTVTADFREFNPQGDLLVDLRIEPSLVDVPNTLDLRLGSESESKHVERLLENEPLTDEITRTVTVPRNLMSLEAENSSIAYSFEGTTIRGQRINLRGVWKLAAVQLRASQMSEPVSQEDIRNAWPGADGSPVRRDHGFHGREADIHRIEQLLNAQDRQRSVMVFGQRRIGKTSLLHAIVNSLTPGPGHLCGVFIDLKGLETNDRSRPLSQLLFDHVISFLDTDTYNTPILNELRSTSGFRSVRKMAAELFKRPALNTQLEGLVQMMGEMTNGRVSRVAFFLDEFDRFVSPLFDQRKEEVDTVMWSLRQIAQRSQRISLVLAGSGLQRLLVDNPEDALFGSIDRVQLEPFRWQNDSQGIQDTFLPTNYGIRSRIIGQQPTETALQRMRDAQEICGGHPYYLVLLGQSLALAAKGRILTRPLLNEVVDQMICGKLRSPIREVGANLFYYGAFEDLKRLEPRQTLRAKILLAYLSQQVTTELPWLSNRVLGESREILDRMSENDCYDLLPILDKEGILEFDRNAGRVRIRIPITAKALREDALQILDEAGRTLKSLERKRS